MAPPTTYLTTTKNLRGILAAIQKASVPSKFTYAFLSQLGFPSSSDRPVIAVLKALRFLDDGGVPTDRYRRYRAQNEAGAVMAEALRDAYADVFAVNQEAHKLTPNDLRSLFNRLSGKSESVTDKMAMTFRSLVDVANFDAVLADPGNQIDEGDDPGDPNGKGPNGNGGPPPALSLRHDVHVHLPESTNIAVYDAIFRSLREHLAE